MFHPPALQIYLHMVWKAKFEFRILRLKWYRGNRLVAGSPPLSVPSSILHGKGPRGRVSRHHRPHVQFQSWPQACGPTHCSVVCPWKGGPREEAHTAPESSLGPLREMILGSWVPGLGGEGYRLQRAQTPGGYIPWPHGALPLWGAVEGSPVQGPVNCLDFEQGPPQPRSVAKIKRYNDTQCLWPQLRSWSDWSVCGHVLCFSQWAVYHRS